MNTRLTPVELIRYMAARVRLVGLPCLRCGVCGDQQEPSRGVVTGGHTKFTDGQFAIGDSFSCDLCGKCEREVMPMKRLEYFIKWTWCFWRNSEYNPHNHNWERQRNRAIKYIWRKTILVDALDPPPEQE